MRGTKKSCRITPPPANSTTGKRPTRKTTPAQHTRNKRIPPARICAARRLPRDVSARSPDRSARCFLDTADASPPNRSVSALGKCPPRLFISSHTGRLPARPGPLGLHQTVVRQLCRFLVFALSWTARPCDCDRRQTQTGTDARPLDRSVAKLLCFFGGLPPLSHLLPAEPRLLDFYASATSRVIRLFRHWGYQSGSERVSPLHLSRHDVLLVRPSPVPTA